ncbi:MAG TPA: class II fructose-bisphosphate aldolase [Candidatus Latescibacteria bacterium]|nr:class II fructose-bisphosphate aldolase [Candidatus Latescibacterota bacterium]
MSNGLAELSFQNNPYLKKVDGRHLVNLRTVLSVADREEFGVLAANSIRPEIVRGVLRAAFDLNSPVIIQVAESQVGYALKGWFLGDGAQRLDAFSEFVAGEVARLREEKGYMIPVALHLDHLQKQDELAFHALKAGFTSVELDFSKQPTEDRGKAVELNIQRCSKIIPELHKYGITVEVEEGEIGEAAVQQAMSEEEIRAQFTPVEHAVRLVEGTDPDALAVFVGSAHGWYLKRPIVGFRRIREIAVALSGRGFPVPIVLHGGTGLSIEAFHKAIGAGARKFNYATALADIVLRTIASEPSGKGKALVEKMTEEEKKQAEEKGRKSRGPRYVLGQFAQEISTLGDFVLKAAEDAVYDHARGMISQALGSAEKAPLYEGYGRSPLR